MLKYVAEFGKYVLIAGLKNIKDFDIEEIVKGISKENQPSVAVQFFNAQLVATWQHLYFAALNALMVFENRRNISKSLAVETVLFASAQRQIRKAMELLGVKPGMSEIALLIIGEDLQTVKTSSSAVLIRIKAENDDSILELSREKIRAIKNAFGIFDLELNAIAKNDDLEEALTNLVIERMALLATQR